MGFDTMSLGKWSPTSTLSFRPFSQGDSEYVARSEGCHTVKSACRHPLLSHGRQASQVAKSRKDDFEPLKMKATYFFETSGSS
jgi:hypothetical protein